MRASESGESEFVYASVLVCINGGFFFFFFRVQLSYVVCQGPMG